MSEIEPYFELGAEFDEWYSDRPPHIREMVALCPPNYAYRMASTGQIVHILAYSEDRTVRVMIMQGHNIATEVFGVSIDDLSKARLEEVR